MSDVHFIVCIRKVRHTDVSLHISAEGIKNQLMLNTSQTAHPTEQQYILNSEHTNLYTFPVIVHIFASVVIN